jgi:hypothetical protein
LCNRSAVTLLVCALGPLVISALLSSSLANTSAPPSLFLALCADSLQDHSSSRFWPSRAGPRAGPSTLRSASARRRRRGVSPARGPRLVAPLLGLRGPGSDIRLPLLDHRGGGRPRSAPQARGAAAGVLPGPRPVPHRSACRAPWARLGSSVSLPSTTVAAVVFAPPRMRAAPPPGPCPARGPRPAGTCPPPGKRHAGPVQTGNGVGLVPVSRCPGCARGATFQRSAVVFAPPRKRAARAPITSLPGPGGPCSHSRRLPPIPSPLFALAGRQGRRYAVDARL